MENINKLVYEDGVNSFSNLYEQIRTNFPFTLRPG